MSNANQTSCQPSNGTTSLDPHLGNQGPDIRVTGKTSSAQPKEVRACTWIARIGFALVFAINVHCALSFVAAPESFASAYELSGVAGNVALQGIGVAFLMWNVPSAVYLAQPARFLGMGWVAIVQQTIGLVGESIILAGIPAGHTILADSIMRFIAFDAMGLIIMMGVHGALVFALHKSKIE